MARGWLVKASVIWIHHGTWLTTQGKVRWFCVQGMHGVGRHTSGPELLHGMPLDSQIWELEAQPFVEGSGLLLSWAPPEERPRRLW